jgi:hypothetical protein
MLFADSLEISARQVGEVMIEKNKAVFCAVLLLAITAILTLVGCGGGGASHSGGPQSQATITAVAVTCSPTSVPTGGTSKCNAAVSGTGNFSTSVTWSATSASIDQSGNFTAPASATTATVTAASTQDSTKSGTTKVAVAPSIVSTAFSYTGSYGTPVFITYTDNSGQVRQALGYPGQVQLFATPSASSSNITALIKANGGTVIGQIPFLGYYLVSVSAGTESTFISSVSANSNVLIAMPSSPVEKADAVDLSNLEGPNGELPTVPNLKAQVGSGVYLYDPDDYVNNSMPCGSSSIAHGAGTDYIASQNLSGTGQQINIFRQGTSMVPPNDVASANAIEFQDMTFNGTGRAVVNLSLQGAWEDANHNVLTAAQYQANEHELLWGYAAALSALAKSSPTSFNQTVFVLSAGNGVGDTGTTGLDLSAEVQQLHAAFPLVFPSGQGPHMIIVGSTQSNSTATDTGFNYSTINGDLVYAQGHQAKVSASGCTADGTSFAAPEVTNLIATVLAGNPNVTVSQVTQAFMNAYKQNGYVLPTVDQITTQLQASFSLLISTTGTGSGSVVPSPTGTNCGAGCYSYSPGTVVQLNATVNAGSSFAGWSGACTGTSTCSLTLNSNETVSADFEVSNSGGGVTFNGAASGSGSYSSSCSTSFTGTISISSPIALVPYPGGIAGSWQMSGTLSGSGSSCAFSQSYSDGGSATFNVGSTGSVSATLGGNDCNFTASGTTQSLSGSGPCGAVSGTVSFTATAK